jgi:hypothetical protein
MLFGFEKVQALSSVSNPVKLFKWFIEHTGFGPHEDCTGVRYLVRAGYVLVVEADRDG